jgi:two-component system, OmpR family, phosphate regulon response regulator PhoB
MKKILIVEDDLTLGETLKERLEVDFEVSWAANQTQAIKKIKENDFDLVILDIGLPDGDGFQVAKSINKAKSHILFLTAQSDAESRLQGYELGAEEFIPKPFHLKELMIRIRHVLTDHSVKPNRLTVDGIEVDFNQMSVRKRDGTIEYPAQSDLKIIEFLIKKSPQPVTRDELMDFVWGQDKNANIRSIDNAIVRIKKFLDLNNDDVIRNVRGIGYQWVNADKNTGR